MFSRISISGMMQQIDVLMVVMFVLMMVGIDDLVGVVCIRVYQFLYLGMELSCVFEYVYDQLVGGGG